MKKTIASAARMLLLRRLREDGVIDDLTLQAVGDALGVNRSTILRNLRDLDRVEAEYQRLMEEQPWIKKELPVPEFAGEIGASPDTVRAMLRDGLIEAVKRPPETGRWYIPVGEIERFRR